MSGTFRELIEQSLQRARESTLSVLGISHPGLRAHLAEQMGDELGVGSCFLASPVFEHTFGWTEARETLGTLENTLLSKELLDALERAVAPYQFMRSARPYAHQLQTWKTLKHPQPKSVVITTGTGSGKTECFMLPILDDLITERAKQGRPLVGVRALFLYPLNALINSQQERLDAWTKSFGEDIRFCLYNGRTEQSAAEVRKEQQLKKNQVLSRELLRREPAPLLMTNATMLEYMLVRQVDSPILEISRGEESLRWIVLDEAHTYVGSQAAEIALLLRRVLHAFGRKAGQVRFVATSATIAGNDAADQLRRYLADLAGVPLHQVEVISGARVWPDIEAHEPPSEMSMDAIRDIDRGIMVSPARFKALARSGIARQLRHAVVSSAKPLDLSDLIQVVERSLQGSTLSQRQREVLDWLDLMTATRPADKQPAFLVLRIHVFQRMLHGLWSCVDPVCSAKRAVLADWPFGNVHAMRRDRCECHAPVYELGFCEDCKTPHLVAEDRGGELRQISPYVGDEFALTAENTDEEGSDEEDAVAQELDRSVAKLVLSPSSIAADPYGRITLDVDTLRLGSLKSATSMEVTVAGESQATCGVCQAGNRQGRSFLSKAYLGAPFYVAKAVPTVLEFCPDPSREDCDGKSPEELPGRGRKLITFTDSRQGTARMAVRMQQEAERSRLRGLVFEILRNAQARAESTASDTSKTSAEELLNLAATMEKMGLTTEAGKYRAEAASRKSGALPSRPRATMGWSELVEELAAARDVSQSILDYNKYANPQLFDGHQAGGAMARLLLTREYGRRPKNQNSTETLGLVCVGYAGLERITAAPAWWLETSTKGASPRALTLEDWRDFLKTALDFFVRENTFIRLSQDMQRWIGSRFTPKVLFPPQADIIESTIIKKWPQIKKGPGSRLVRILEVAMGLERGNPVHVDLINSWLESAWYALVGAGILEPAEQGYALNLNTLRFSLPSQGWVCPLTHRLLDVTLTGVTPYLPIRPLDRSYHCRKVGLPATTHLSADGSAVPKTAQIRSLVAQDKVIAQLRRENLWTDISDRTVEGGFYYRTAEHSAQQSSEKLDRYVDLFKHGKVNVLNCSTTMEMGVDIGGIAAVVMNNVPPHPANYLQRAGRAGRRSEPRSVAYTLCKADPHNQRAFAAPKWPFVTAIPAPTITLSSERIVQRHVNSLLLAVFLSSHSDSDRDRTKLTLKWFFLGEVGEGSPAERFIVWLRDRPAAIIEPVRELTRNTALGSRHVDAILQESIASLEESVQHWVLEYNKLDRLISEAVDDAYKKALELEMRRHQDEYLLRDLVARGYLPAYGFPTNVVSLKNYNVEDFMHSRNRKASREDNIYSHKDQPTRRLDVAIREYAPGAQVVVDGRVYRAAGVSLQWHAQGQISEVQKFDVAWRCSTCGAAGVAENAYANNASLVCSLCAAEIPYKEKKIVLRPAGFITDFYEPTTNDVSSQKYIRVERPRVQLVGEVLALPDSRCGFARFGHDGSVFYHSSGEHERGYAVCLACGRAESMTLTGEVPKALAPDKSHRPVGGPAGSHKEKDCSGASVKASVYLGYQINTDVLELFLKDPLTGSWLSDSDRGPIVAATLAVALRDVIADELGIASDEMGFGMRPDRDLVSGQGRSVIQVFDQMNGGAGFVLAGIGDLAALLGKVRAKLECKAECENVCSHCLAGKDSRVEFDELDRRGAKDWLDRAQYVQHLVLPASMSSIPGARYCSLGPLRAIRSAIQRSDRNEAERTLRIAIAGDSQAWDLAYPRFKETILTWLMIDKVQIQLGIEDVEQLDEEVADELARLETLGLRIFQLDSQWQIAGVAVAAQYVSKVETLTLLCTSKESLVPGPDWLDAGKPGTWAMSSRLPRLSPQLLKAPGRAAPASGTTLVEVTDELDGALSDLKSRWLALLTKHVPQLAERLEHDRVKQVTYTDRYLRAPWSLMLLGNILQAFRSADPFKLVVQTAEKTNWQQSYQLTHDWFHTPMLAAAIDGWLSQALGVPVTVQIKQQARNLQHGRVLKVEWVSGVTTRIIFDQGMGYWQLRMKDRDVRFDFTQPVADQIRRMKERQRFASLTRGGDWPTFITVIPTVSVTG